MFLIAIVIGIVTLLVLYVLISALFRIAVPTNEVHVVQSKNYTIAFGKNQKEGSVYFNRPSWFPIVGITRTALPTTVFDITIEDYQAYDIWRVPFWIDVKAFFRISDSLLASERIDTFDQLIDQLHDVLKSSIRSILSNSDIEEILSWRSEFSMKFTSSVKEQLNKDRWIEVVKNIEFMEIRDWHDSEVISNIQKKKESEILKHSRIAIAENNREASLREIEAQKEVEVKEQEKRQLVWQREIETNNTLAIQDEQSRQQVKEQEKITKEKEMDVLKVNEIKNAEIQKEKEIIESEREARKQIISSEAQKESQKNRAEAELLTAQKNSEAIKSNADAESEKIRKTGNAEAETIKNKEVSLIAGKVELMKEMQENKEYAMYLQAIEQIAAQREVGVAQAKALESADIKYLGTDGTLNASWSLSELVTPSGLGKLWLGLEAFANMTDKKVLDIFGDFLKLPKEKQEKIIKQIWDNDK